MNRELAAIFSVAVLTFFMVGCATMRGVDSDVTAFYQWSAAPPAPGTAYRFERLPSQRVVGAQQDYVEGLARTALTRVGMQADPAVARYSVQVMVNTLVVERLPYDGPGYDGFGFATPGVFLGGGSRGASAGLSLPMRFSEPYYRRELTLLMRDLASGQLVFETRAASEGAQSETLPVLSAMLDAALSGFPQPPSGTRRIHVEIPR
jgi:predicted small secreted protein